MRKLCLLALAGVFLLGACDSAQDLTAPVEPDVVGPTFHPVWPGDGPDGAYSMYWFDLDLRNNLVLKVGQAWNAVAAPDATRCPYPNDPGPPYAHHTEADDPTLANVAGLFSDPGYAAQGIGHFSTRIYGRRASGLLIVKGACWFEWNAKGFPESAWVWGRAWSGFWPRDFWVKLESHGFPDQGHLLELDWAELHLRGPYPSPVMRVIGELHHEDGLSLIG